MSIVDVNEPPVFTDFVEKAVSENSDIGRQVGAPVTSTDPDSRDPKQLHTPFQRVMIGKYSL